MTLFGPQVTAEAWDLLADRIAARTPDQVLAALDAPRLTPDHLTALLSPAATPRLEEMAVRAHRLTAQRFGRAVTLFAPLYLSNECINRCRYCGFNASNTVPRVTLEPHQAVREARVLHEAGFRHILLVSGEAPHVVTPDYLKEVVRGIGPLFSSIAVEIHPLDRTGYAELAAAGVDGLVVYQETYDPRRYAEVHPAGAKRDFAKRLATPDLGGQAGLRRVGIGALLGLSDDWRVEGYFLGLHAAHLMRAHWRTHVTVSFPRMRPAAGCLPVNRPVDDRALVQLMLALRLFLPDAGMVLSTRERPDLRDRLVPLGVTMISAGSHTEPGGYTGPSAAAAQFEVADDRSPDEVARKLRDLGYDPVWKDWDSALTGGATCTSD